jgi:pimeloyl-ACP methyl ester carboxylesterase
MGKVVTVFWRMFFGLLFASLLAIGGVASGNRTVLADDGVAGSFEATDCMFDPLIPGMRDETIECGYLTVPEQRRGESNDGRTIRLAVAILGSSSENPLPDPLFIAQGGPGGSTIDTYANLLVDHPLRQERDIVLFDQRGTLYSEPNLLCSESFDATSELLASDAEEEDDLSREIGAACRQRLVDEGINLAAYNSLENAADIEDLRIALEYDAINFYGVSYGTLLGLHFMRDFPDNIRSVILDGVVAPQTNFITRVAQSEERVYSEFFAACENDVSCAELYPDLEDRFFALVEELNDNPAAITLTDPETGERTRTALWGDDIVDFLFQMFYVSGSVGALPAVIADVERGDYSYLETMFSVFLFDRSMSEGMYNSVICAEEADFDATDALVDGVRPEFVEGMAEELQDMIDGCAQWDVPVLPVEVNEPVASDIPTLLLSGLFDPITPPQFADMAQETLPNSYNFVLPTGGHGVAFAVDDCIDRIVDDFLDDPQTEPSSGCLEWVEPLEFAADNAKTVPILGYLNSLSANAWKHVGIAALLLAGILSAFVLWPLGWFLRAVRNVQVERSESETQWRWGGRLLIVLFGVMALMFVSGFILVTVGVVLFNTNLMMLSAMPRTVMPLFLLPFGLALTTVGLLIVAVQQWRKGFGSLWDRLYYSFLLVCALGYVYILYLDGMFGVII